MTSVIFKSLYCVLTFNVNLKVTLKFIQNICPHSVIKCHVQDIWSSTAFSGVLRQM